MSNIVSKIRQRIALRDKNKFDLSCDHFTTGDFMQLSPVFIQELVPGESINVKEQVFTRLAPLVKPMYGRARIELRKFFVPMRTIMRGWNEYITDTTVDGVIPSLPTIALHNIASALTNSSFSTQVNGTSYDFKVENGTGVTATTTLYRFTSLGKSVWKVLNSLGYKFPIGYWVSNTEVTQMTSRVSALPLLAFIKIYSDWYKNQAYNDATFFGLFESVGSTSLDDVNKLISVFLRVSRICYDKDELFVSAWDRPTTPNDGLVSNYNINDITNDASNPSTAITRSTRVTSLSSPTSQLPSTPHLKSGNVDYSTSAGSQSSIPGNITQYAIDSLKALTDYVKRHQIAGGLAMDRMMARFGMKPSDAALKRSIYLGKNSVDIQIADVMATANGQDGSDQSSALGDYAGKGVGYNDGAVSYSTDEYGYLVFCASIIPSAHYVQGMQPQVFRGLNGRLDFFTPEFDGIGVDALPRKMVLADYNGGGENNLSTLGYSSAIDGVFGFAPRYAAYKASFDNLTGDFAVPSMNAANTQEVWHLNRMFEASAVTLSSVTHNLDFVSSTDAGQYDRIFAIQDDAIDENANRYDHFYTIYHFEVESWKPMRKLFDDYDFDGGKDVTLEVNGTQLN